MRPNFEIFKAIIRSTITLGVITGTVYLAGIFYDGGILETLNIETSLFPKSFEEHVLTGGLTVFSKYMRIIIYLPLALAAPFLILFLAWLVKDSRFIIDLFGKTSTQLGLTPDHHVSLQSLIIKALYAFFIGLSFIVFVWIAVSILISSYESGVEYAEKLITEQNTSSNGSSSKILLVNEQVISGHIVRCSEHGCAVLNKNSVVIIPINEISKIESPPKQPENRSAPTT